MFEAKQMPLSVNQPDVCSVAICAENASVLHEPEHVLISLCFQCKQ